MKKNKKEKKVNAKNPKENNTKKVENKEEKALIKTKQEKEKKPNKFIETLKKKWLVNSARTCVLVLLIIVAFLGISVWMQKLDITPIDLTDDKLYTLTDESKEQVKNIDKDINIYFVGYDDNDSTVDLAKEYTKVNDKIKVEAVTTESRPDLAQKYGLESSSQGIIVESGDRYKVLSSSDLTSYDSSSGESVNVAEEKLTSAIKSVTVDKLPKVYFLSGYSQYTLQSGLYYLNMYLQNEINEVDSLDILSTGKVPDDCNVLVITSPSQDFDEITTNAITDYINKGGNILWLNSAMAKQMDLPNVNKILALYGVQPFEVGVIRETDTSKMVANSPDLIMPEIQYADVTSKIYQTDGVIFANATKINVADSTTMENLKVTETELLKTSEGSYFRSNFANTANEPQDGEEKKSYTVGAQFDKIITEKNEENNTPEVKSKLILFGENYFASDAQLSQSTQAPMIAYRKNKDLVLNSIAYLSNREEDITVRKATSSVTYTASETENRVILAIIFGVPVLIIVVGVIVWIRRKRRK